jgi:uncharacterized protein YlxP (DUF503 family)
VFIGVLHLEVRIPGCRSLKEKRQVLNSVISGLRHKYNASVAETDFQDAWQKAGIGVAFVSGDSTVVRRMLGRIEETVSSEPRLEIVAVESEVL